MSRLLDPMHRRYIEALGIGPDARTLEVGFGNGSVSAWLAELVGPTGQAVAVDIDLSLVDQNGAPANLDYLQADIVAGPVDPGTFDLVTARAVLHHVTDVDAAMRNLVTSLAPGGAILLIEPDFLPVSIAEPAEVHRFWEAGCSGRASRASTTSSAARSHDGSPRWASTTSTAPRKRPSTKAVRRGPPTGWTR